MIEFTPPRPILGAEIETWRISHPASLYDENMLAKHGEVILKIVCEDVLFYLVLKKEDHSSSSSADRSMSILDK